MCSGSWCILVVPDLQQVVASTSDESPLLARSRVGADQAARGGGRCPADRIHTHTVGVENLVSPAVVTEFENANMSV